MVSSQVQLGAAILLVLLGLGSIGGGAYLSNYIGDQLDQGIKDALVIDGPKDKNYQDWLKNTDADDPPKYKKYYFWNLTNPDEVLTGNKPVYEEVGPYVYRQYDIKFNVEFSGDTVAFATQTYYVFQADMSSGKETDKIVNINPAYLGVLQKAGSESALVIGMTGPGLETMITNLQTDFVPQVVAQAFPEVLLGVQEEITYQLYASVNASTTAQTINESLRGLYISNYYNSEASAFEDFFNNPTWQADITTILGAQNAPPMKGVSEWATNSLANLSFSKVAQQKILLGDPTYQLPGWYYESSKGLGVLGFLQAYKAAKEAGNTTILKLGYNVTDNQLDALAGYLQYMFNDIVPVVLQSQFGAGITAKMIADWKFYEQWANGSVDEAGFDITQDGNTPDGFEAAILLNGTVNPTGINRTTAMKLFDPNEIYSLTNATMGAGIYVWYGAAMGNTTLQTLLSSTFGLNSTQLGQLLMWIGTFKDNLIPPLLVNELSVYGVSGLNDIAYLQWGNMSALAGASVKDLDPDSGLPGYPEFSAWASNVQGVPYAFNASKSKELLNGTNGFFDAVNLGTFLTLVQLKQNDTIKALWGLSETESQLVAGYLQYFSQAFIVNDTLLPIFAQGGGLVSTRTVYQWLWDYTDPLLAVVNPQDPKNNLFTNETQQDPNEARDVFNTGKNDISKIWQYVEWKGNTTITGVWKEDVEIKGTDATQFAPGTSKEDTLIAFVSDLLRPVELTFVEETSLYGIKLLRFKLADSVLASEADNPSNAIYYQTITGIANMTSAKGAPVFLSKPHFLGAEGSVLQAISGVNPNEAMHDTFIDVDPITGTVMSAAKRLQVNLQVSASRTDTFYPQVYDDGFYPLVWVEEGGQLTQDLANSYKDKIYGAQDLQQTSQIAGLVVGALLLLAGLAGTSVIVRKR